MLRGIVPRNRPASRGGARPRRLPPRSARPTRRPLGPRSGDRPRSVDPRTRERRRPAASHRNPTDEANRPSGGPAASRCSDRSLTRDRPAGASARRDWSTASPAFAPLLLREPARCDDRGDFVEEALSDTQKRIQMVHDQVDASSRRPASPPIRCSPQSFNARSSIAASPRTNLVASMGSAPPRDFGRPDDNPRGPREHAIQAAECRAGTRRAR